MAYQPYGTPGLLVADIDLTAATRLLATAANLSNSPGDSRAVASERVVLRSCGFA